MQPVNLPPFRSRVRQQRTDDIHGVVHDASRPHFLDLRVQRRQHAAEIEIARLDQVGGRPGVQEIQLFSSQIGEFPAEAFGIGDDARRRFFKSDKDARLIEMLRAMHQELQCEERLARAGSAHQQGGAATR